MRLFPCSWLCRSVRFPYKFIKQVLASSPCFPAARDPIQQPQQIQRDTRGHPSTLSLEAEDGTDDGDATQLVIVLCPIPFHPILTHLVLPLE